MVVFFCLYVFFFLFKPPHVYVEPICSCVLTAGRIKAEFHFISFMNLLNWDNVNESTLVH